MYRFNGNHLILRNKQHYREILLSRFRLKIHTLRFYAESNVRITLYSIINSATGKNCSVDFILMDTIRISSTGSKVRNTFYSVINSTTGKYCSVAFI